MSKLQNSEPDLSSSADAQNLKFERADRVSFRTVEGLQQKAGVAAGMMSWVQRIRRVREPCPDLMGANGWRVRVVRSSNGPKCSESKSWSKTPNQDFFLT